MENRKAVLELKDVPPPPPHHTSTSHPSHSFPLAPLTLLPPCLPPTQLDSREQQPLSLPAQQEQQEGGSPKVSSCTHCDCCRTDGYGILGGGSVVGSSNSSAAAVSVCKAPNSQYNSISRSGSCSVSSSVYQNKHNISNQGEVLGPSLGLACKPQLLSSVATSQPISSHPHLSCCSGLLHTYPSVPQSRSQPSLCTSTAPLAPPVPCVSSLSVPLHGSCLASSGCYSCGMTCCSAARTSQRRPRGDHLTATTTVSTTTTSAHFCSNPLHFNVERTVCLKGAYYCRECTLKVGEALYSITEDYLILYAWVVSLK